MMISSSLLILACGASRGSVHCMFQRRAYGEGLGLQRRGNLDAEGKLQHLWVPSFLLLTHRVTDTMEADDTQNRYCQTERYSVWPLSVGCIRPCMNTAIRSELP